MKFLFLLIISMYPLAIFAESEEDLAHRYAPMIFQGVDSANPELDFISRVDFDGDLVGNNNWENATVYSLNPVVYYAVVSTTSHHFITYSIFHPRDWASWCTGLFYECHENDMENLQIITERKSGNIVALVTQAHFWSSVYLTVESDESDGRIVFENDRVAAFIASRTHAIYGVDNRAQSKVNNIIYYPDQDTENVEPDLRNGKKFSYKLESTLNKFWLPVLNGELYGSGKLFNKTFNYEDPQIAWDDVPRYFDSDMMSGVGKYSAGIVPFAMGFSLLSEDVGGLFFNPAYHFKNELTLASKWSTSYTYHPYR